MTRKSFEQIMRAAGTAAAKLRRDHVVSTASASQIAVSLDAIELRALDLWIAGQPDPKPDRGEAARRLINEALTRKESRAKP
ncbi:MAG: hypothetical protein ACHQAY_05540 [Hyphomicrobiales bacterium]